ncbi:amino-acid permease inda1 [Coprinopsis cinerea okayama7|uniref:Amino-acid permease inda1 n=1 Tax=Coprinopsis cinerea (strain Okayama-7 / 130 / ATCC MYA-4618 / FGSC 9003) TaxID=240176 RepID=A8NNY0_COPC7|nr:amino-acid permease inda1 [Coprinopsis cinerea okayama7\|eukprot:XP_001835221.1 amino-acid permease inda1 [Coprinopsis cinerea okayama7\
MDPKYEKDSKEVESSSVSSQPQARRVEFYDPSKESKWTRIGLTLESFKRAPGTTGGQVVNGANNVEDLEKIMADAPMLQQKMKPRHLQMIAVGGSIGTGLFVGSGAALYDGGPAALLICWLLIGIMLINVTQALGEMAILYPVSGGFYTLAIRFLDPSFAFAMGWNYVFQWAVVLPLEITVAARTIQYWPETLKVPLAVWITIFWAVIVIFAVFGTIGFAEEEFWSSCLKLLVVVVFVIIGIVCICGGGPSDGEYSSYVGGKHWSDPGGFANGFKGVCAVFVTAAFSFAGTELVGLAASETPNPRKTMPTAVKGTFWRITVIYITSLTIIGLLIPYNEERLVTGEGAAASPFVIALDNAKIPGFNHLVNVTICISVLSIGLSCVYAGSRTLTALAETGYAPKIFTYVDKSSRPLWSLIAILVWAPLAYINVRDVGDAVFRWLLALSGLSTLFTWMAICLCHIRFRRAWKVQGHSTDELPYRALGGVYGSWFGVILVILVLIAQFYVALFPLNYDPDRTPGDVAEGFFASYLALPVMIMFYIIGYAWKRTLPQRAHEINLDSGRKSWLTAEEMNAWRAERRAAPLHIRIFRALFTH